MERLSRMTYQAQCNHKSTESRELFLAELEREEVVTMAEGQMDVMLPALTMEKEGHEPQKEDSLPDAKKGKETDSPQQPAKDTTLTTPWI